MAELFVNQAKQYAETRPTSAGIYKKVTGTDTSLKQLEFAPKLPNVSYHHTAPAMSRSELEQTVSAQSSVDLVTIAQAMLDSVLNQFYYIDSEPFWEPQLKLIDDKYRSIDFPFETVEGADHTGPFKFVAEKLMDLDEYLVYLRSWSAYQTAKTKGVELLRDDRIESFKRAWNEDEHDQKAVKFPVYLRIGKVGNA
ncbi:hypothetical protein DKX38_023655 [Salix brachista]|uniref:Uncharacterized protein n=1 Tax=Salix brachista TaxID=2182728 RepID=A0A5N5JLC6_9ROSI|nr:hypothetical protein DKX38_023655 [Salix brachista]